MALLFLAATPLVIFLTHAVLVRLWTGAASQKVAAAALVLGAVPQALLLSTVPPVGLGYAAVVYSGLGYAYFHLFNLGETGRRIRILREIHAAGALGREEIASIYGTEGLMDVRLDRLVATGQLAVRDGRYVLTGHTLHRIALLIEGWRSLLGFGRR